MPISGTTSIGLDAGKAPAPSARNPELEQAAKAFEAIFLRQMIGAMRSSSLSEGIFDNQATEQFRDMADARTADEMAKSSTFGIAELLMRQFAPKVPLTSMSATALKPEIALGSVQETVQTTPGKGDEQ